MIRYLLYFPSVTFSVISAEIFPWGFLYSVFRKISLTKELFFLVFMMAFSVLWGVFEYNETSFEIVRSLAAYGNVLLVYFAAINLSKIEREKLINTNTTVFYLLFLIGILQFTGMFSLLGLGYIIELLINRGAEGVIGSGRGVALLSSEPSRAGYEFLFIYMLFRFTKLVNVRKGKVFLFDILVSLFILLFIKSALAAIFLFIYMFYNYRSYIYYTFPFVFVLVLLLGLNLNNLIAFLADSNTRSLVLASLTLQTIIDGGFWNLFMNASGFRGVSIYSAYLIGFNDLIGHGIGNWEKSSLIALESSGYSPADLLYFSSREGIFTSIRPTSFIASLMLDVGVIGVSILLYCIRRILILYTCDASRGILYCFAFYIFFIGSVGNPVPWLVVGIVAGILNTSQGGMS